MELETQVQVSTNQLRRQDEEARQLREDLDAALQRERALQARQREFQHKYADLESKVYNYILTYFFQGLYTQTSVWSGEIE